MQKHTKEKTLHELFDVGIFLKGVHAVIEIVAGVFTFFISPHFIFRVVDAITFKELVDDPTDRLSNYLLASAHNFSVGTKQFIAFYLLSHGIVNMVLVIGLFKKKMWAYYASFVALTIFVLYQIYRYVYDPSVWLIVLTIFDVIIIWLIWREYKAIQHRV
jgi:uncharacterized membrane protein